MSDHSPPARERWNDRYAGGAFEPFPDVPVDWLDENASLLRELLARERTPKAIDVACGDGRAARRLAELGFDVEAIDVSDVAVARLREAAAERDLRIDARVVDLEHEGLAADAYDVIVCMHFLQRDLFDSMRRALRPGGLLLYETFDRSHIEDLGRAFNPAYVLERNELLHAFGDLHVRHYRGGPVERRGELRGVSSLAAQRPSA